MRNQWRLTVTALALVFGSGCAVSPQNTSEFAQSSDLEPQTMISKENISADLEVFVSFVKNTHPNLSRSANVDALEGKKNEIATRLTKDLSLRNAWMEMALLNPLFGDAHVGLRRPLAAIEAYQSAGGMLFPGEVYFDSRNELRLKQEGGIDPAIVSINGYPAEKIVSELEPRMRGETLKLGRLIMVRYFPEFFWTAYGGFERYVVETKNGDHLRKIILNPSKDEIKNEEVIRYELTFPRSDIAFLEIPSFNIVHLEQFQQFIQKSFAAIAEMAPQYLVIDLRQNGGGASDLSDILARHITEKPFSAISAITARVTPENQQLLPGSEIGDIVSTAFQLPVHPNPELKNRFLGDVYILIGPLTYSQSIAFAAAMQDHDVATLVGEQTEGPANQSGQVQRKILGATGFEALSPIYVFTRANGDKGTAPLNPDIEIINDPEDPDAVLDALLEIIDAQ